MTEGLNTQVDARLGIYSLRLPLPFRLNHINSYAVRGAGGWWLVDTGLSTEPTRKMWLDFMALQGISPGDIRAIYLTHAHPDHFGAAGWLQALTGAPVFISAVDRAAVQRIWQDRDRQTADMFTAMFIANGMPMPLTKDAAKEVNTLAASTQPLPGFSTVEYNAAVQLGDFEYRTIPTPGHSDGHVCYFNEEYGVLLSGDHLLPKITSNISLWPDAQPDPLANYLNSLQDNLQLPVDWALPAHGQPFRNVKERIQQLLAHHAERLKLMKDLVKGETTVYSVCKQVFGDTLNAHEVRFAMAETAAHLMYLVYKGDLVVEERAGIHVYRCLS